MKKNISKTNKNSAKLLVALFAILSNFPLAFADDAAKSSCPDFAPISSDGNCPTCDIIKTLSTIHCKSTEMIHHLAFAIDNLIQGTLHDTNDNLLKSKQLVNTAVSNSSSNLTSYYLSGMDVKKDDLYALATKPAEDVSGQKPTKTPPKPTTVEESKKYDAYSPLVFASKTKDDSTAIMNMDTLLGPLQYTPQQQSDAQSLIRIIETLAPVPDIIRISNKFTIPYSPDSGSTTYTVDLTDPAISAVAKLNPALANAPSAKVKDLLDNLDAEESYRKYKMDYRSAIVARSMILNTLLRIYQERVPLTPNGKSQAALDYDAATWRIDPQQRILPSDKPNVQTKLTYYEKMQTASPSIISRETLFLLAEIRYELYQLRQQNQQMVALQSLLGLQMAQMGKTGGDSQTKQIAKLIYCKAVNNDPCKDQSTTTDTSTAVQSPGSSTEGIKSSTPKP